MSRIFKMSRNAALLAGSVIGVALPSVVQAQQLEEVIVTAQRRSESVQDISLSVTSIESDELERLDLDSSTRLQNFVVNLSVRSNSIGSTDYAIRGVGRSDDNISTDSGVGVFLDDIYLPRNSAAAGTMLDLERVEVLRGPQGTLYGRNTSGGSINYVTSRPGDAVLGRVSLNVGNFEKLDFKGYVSAPLVPDRVFGKVSAYSLNDQGYVVNTPDGVRGRRGDSSGGRIGLRFLPHERVELFFTADYEKTNPGPNLATLGPNDGFRSQIFGTIDGGRAAFGLPLLFEAGLPANPDYTSNVNFVAGESFESRGFMGRLDVFLDDLDASLIAGLRRAETFYHEDTDRTPHDYFNELHREDAEWGSLELRLVSNPNGNLSAGGRLFWTGGLYYFFEDSRQDVGFGGTQIFEALGLAALFPPLTGAFGELGFKHGIRTDAYALFGQADYALTDRFRVVAGLRFTDEEKTFDAATHIIDPTEAFAPILVQFGALPPWATGLIGPGFNGGIIDEIYDTSNTEGWDDLLGKVALEYDLGGTALLYGLASEGFKSGGFSGTPNTARAAATAYMPEEVLTLEAGLKSTLFDERMRLNVAVFHTEFGGLQAGLFSAAGGTPRVINQDAEIMGVELETKTVLTDGLVLGFNIGQLDSEIIRDVTTPANEGLPIFEIPELTYNANLTYAFTSSFGDVELRADYVWEDEVLNSPGFGSSPQWQVLDLRAAWTPGSGGWEIALWGRNVLDEVYWNSNGLSAFGSAPLATPRKLAAPATYGASFTYSFGERN